jgi:hypothetical protein
VARRPAPLADLAGTIAEAIEMLRDYAGAARPQPPAEPLPSLLEECEALCAAAAGPEPVRLIHHFACTGGTLISKCIAALPNTVVLSEIDPLSRPHFLRPRGNSFIVPNKDRAFQPTDLIMALRTALRPVPDSTLAAVFAAAVAAMRQELARRGLAPVIRDHPHSQFCTDIDPDGRPTLREILAASMPVVSLVTVRHPLDSFLALDAHRWRSFAPFTPQEYARRYTLFLDRHADVPVVRYEDVVASPEAGLAGIARHLGLRHSPLALDLFPIVVLSGDSGRTGDRIEARSRRAIPDAIRAGVAAAPAFAALCTRLGYPADPEAG